jgi:hypothetical protein
MTIEITEADKSTPLTVADFKEFLIQLTEAFAAAPPLPVAGQDGATAGDPDGQQPGGEA